MDKITKFLKKRSQKERLLLMAAVDLIVRGELGGLDLKKLKGHKNLYRIRLGHFRIIFEKGEKENWILKIDEKDEGIYKF